MATNCVIESNLTLEDHLLALKKYGNIGVKWLDDGWYASLEIRGVDGVQMSIRSDFNHTCPSDAVNTLVNRLEATIGHQAQLHLGG